MGGNLITESMLSDFISSLTRWKLIEILNQSISVCSLFIAGCISRYSAGSVYYYPSYHHQHNPAQVERFQKDLKRYLTRKIGFEAVMRIRCTKGLWAQKS